MVPAGTGLSRAGKSNMDRECAECTLGKFSAESTDGLLCAPWSNCPVGEGHTADGNADTDRTCTACEDGKFSGSNDDRACQEWGPCPVGVGMTDRKSVV